MNQDSFVDIDTIWNHFGYTEAVLGLCNLMVKVYTYVRIYVSLVLALTHLLAHSWSASYRRKNNHDLSCIRICACKHASIYAHAYTHTHAYTHISKRQCILHSLHTFNTTLPLVVDCFDTQGWGFVYVNCLLVTKFSDLYMDRVINSMLQFQQVRVWL